MALSERIKYCRLVTVYGRLGFSPQKGHPHTFEREDGIMFFHSPYGEDEFYWSQVVEDIENTEKLHGMNDELSLAFTDVLFELYGDDDDQSETP